MEKLKMQTINQADANFEKLASLFPNIVTESIDSNGNVVRAIDAQRLAQEINSVVLEGNDDRYQFTWPDKRKAQLAANAPISATLRPCREESVDFDTTGNLYIEGDNLDVLKCLKETYSGKIKMIYIDPPYNTGNDFVYNDDFAESAGEYLAKSGQYDDQGNRLVTNTESNGRYHTDWLNMIYPRLKVARDLLTDDGVIFISIDDNEVENLRKVCDEVFGESNFVAQVIWKNKFGSGAFTAGFIGVHEYVVVYSKKFISNITRTLTDKEREMYNKTRDDKFEKRGGYVTQPLAVTTFGDRPNLRYPIMYNGQEIWPKKQWVWEQTRMLAAIKNGDVVFNLQKDGTYNLRSKKYLIDENGRERRGKPTTFFTEVYTQNGTEEMRNLFQKLLFDYTKPVDLIKSFISLEINDQLSENDIILDFFSGSATTAHAVMQLNAEDGGNRKFIMVQLPEQTDAKSEAYKAGYQNICEIGKERIRRAGKKIKAENPNASALDTGFRVLKLADSNMLDVYYSPAEVVQQDLFAQADNIKSDRTPEDLLFQVMLELGVLLDSKIEVQQVAGKQVYNVADGFLIACFDKGVTDEVITAIAKLHPQYAVLRDSSYADDSTATNFEQLFKTYSPSTTIKTL